jgi:hypothetical protein
MGICRNITTGWQIAQDDDGFTPFGPDPEKDNVYQNVPQVMLHGMDEGLTMKLCIAVVQGTIAEAIATNNVNNTTSVSHKLFLFICICYIMSIFSFLITNCFSTNLCRRFAERSINSSWQSLRQPLPAKMLSWTAGTDLKHSNTVCARISFPKQHA